MLLLGGKKGKIDFLMHSCKYELLLFKKNRKEPVLFQSECQMILFLAPSTYGDDED